MEKKSNYLSSNIKFLRLRKNITFQHLFPTVQDEIIDLLNNL